MLQLMAAGISVQKLTKHYGPLAAVQDISFEVRAGEIFGLLGPNGAGKTTSIECILGLRQPDEGTIRVGGVDARNQPEQVKRHVGAALQSTALQDKITPRQALRLFSAFYREAVKPADLLAKFGLADKADTTWDKLSGGQQQRLVLALAFVNDPQVLILDEPTAGLDPAARRELHTLITERRDAGCAILFSTHQLDDAQRLCDRVAIIDQGRLVAIAPPAELIARPHAVSRIRFSTTRFLDEKRLQALAGVTGVTGSGNVQMLTSRDVTATMVDLSQFVAREQTELLQLEIQRPTLEDVFLELTGRPWTGADAIAPERNAHPS